jgi:Uma2 family endonuclease
MTTTFVPRQTHERHRFTGEDVLAMMRAGLLLEGGGFELIDGEIIDMPSEGGEHVDLKARLTRFFNRALPDDILVAPDSTLRLSDTYWPQPDLYLYPAQMPAELVRGPDVLLVVELSDTTARYDLGRKADLYRQHGVREYWVLDIVKRQSHVHILDESDAWPREPLPFETALAPSLVSGLLVPVADLTRR